MSETTAAPTDTTAAAPGDIVAVASGNPDFSTLVAAVSAADSSSTWVPDGNAAMR